MARKDEVRPRIRELVGDVGSPGTLRRQAADLSTEMGDHGVVMAIDRATDGEWMPAAVRYKYQHFFTHWTVLAITKFADRNPASTSIPALIDLLRRLQREGGMARDRWIEGMGGARQWRQAREAEERERLERLLAEGGRPGWVEIGLGEKSARLSELWNRLTGREAGDDGGDDGMEEWILDSAARPLAGPSITVLRTWRNKIVAHQDLRHIRMGLAGYEVFPIAHLIRAYWAVMKAAHRALLLADGSGLHGLYPTPQFSIAHELSGGKLDRRHVVSIEERLMARAQRWERLLQQSEELWHLELSEWRRGENQGH